MLAKVLLAKNAETNGFIRDDVEKALYAMVDGVTPQKAICALIIGGARWGFPCGFIIVSRCHALVNSTFSHRTTVSILMPPHLP